MVRSRGVVLGFTIKGHLGFRFKGSGGIGKLLAPVPYVRSCLRIDCTSQRAQGQNPDMQRMVT